MQALFGFDSSLASIETPPLSSTAKSAVPSIERSQSVQVSMPVQRFYRQNITEQHLEFEDNNENTKESEVQSGDILEDTPECFVDPKTELRKSGRKGQKKTSKEISEDRAEKSQAQAEETTDCFPRKELRRSTRSKRKKPLQYSE